MTLANNGMHRTGWDELFAGSDRVTLIKLSGTPSRTMDGDLLIGKHEGRDLLEPLAARDRGGVRFTHSIWQLDDPKASSPILRPILKRQNFTLLQGIRCLGTTVLSPHVPAGKFAAGSSMWTEGTQVPTTNGKLRVGWGIIGSYGKGLGSGRRRCWTTLVRAARSRKRTLCLVTCLATESGWRAYLQIVHKTHGSGEFKCSFELPRYLRQTDVTGRWIGVGCGTRHGEVYEKVDRSLIIIARR